MLKSILTFIALTILLILIRRVIHSRIRPQGSKEVVAILSAAALAILVAILYYGMYHDLTSNLFTLTYVPHGHKKLEWSFSICSSLVTNIVMEIIYIWRQRDSY